jgi:hypothetical protein
MSQGSEQCRQKDIGDIGAVNIEAVAGINIKTKICNFN